MGFSCRHILLLMALTFPCVQGEGRTWLSHHGGLPPTPQPPRRSGSKLTRRSPEDHNAKLVKHVQRTIPKTPSPDDRTEGDHPVDVDTGKNKNKYSYASGAFGFEPELGIY